MYETGDSKSSVWGFVIFFLILFWMVGGGMGGFGFGARGYHHGYENNEHMPKDNQATLTDIRCAQASNFAVLNGSLDTAFRTVINNDNVNTASIIQSQKDIYTKQLEAKVNELFITSQNEQTRNQALLLKADTDAKLATIACQMAKQPPLYTASCSPCTVSSCGCGCGGSQFYGA